MLVTSWYCNINAAWSWWCLLGGVLANGHRWPRFNSWLILKILYQSTHWLSAQVSVTLNTDVGLLHLSVFPAQLAKVINGSFFHLLSSSVWKLYLVNNRSLCLFSLFILFFYPQPRLVFAETVGPRQTGLAQGPYLRILKIGFLFKQVEPFGNGLLPWVPQRKCQLN